MFQQEMAAELTQLNRKQVSEARPEAKPKTHHGEGSVWTCRVREDIQPTLAPCTTDQQICPRTITRRVLRSSRIDNVVTRDFPETGFNATIC
ncbi:hypothetical protein Y1Q_0013764 [Alligator mississippiensis]|uniref:Uncharacterized protein n=1 Tax=Alligator mississippiensis TaxID=8496 RepID=A0A151MM19_ALLMI|nr:hypothetical protein Y1Q_0013764 [Alligator mississippiensis]